MDAEEPQLRQRGNNDPKDESTKGTGKGEQPRMMPPPQPLIPYNHPVNILYRIVVMAGSIYGLQYMDVFHQIMRGPLVSHMWFKIGLASSIVVAGIKAYMELYEGRMRKQKVEYKTYKTCTHLVIVSFLFASFSFHMALWDAFGGARTFFANFLIGYGILLQLSLLLPTWLQNMVTFVAFTFFLQQYQ